MSIREEQCNKVCRILDDVLANRKTERDSLIVAVRKAFEALEQSEQKKGEWIDGGWCGDWAWETDGRGCCWHQWICSECGDYSRRRTKFCPNCGADMRGNMND